jgi:phage tail sheath protein FI
MSNQSLVIDSNLPGVIALVNQSQVARPVQRQPSSTAFAVGYSPWGPVNTPTVVTSWDDYVRQFGPFDANSSLDDFLYTFFNIFPGRQAVVCRVVGATPVLGTLSLKDRSAGAGLNTVRVDAKYASTRVDILVTIADGSVTNTFKLTVRSVLLNRKEIYDNLTIDAAVIAKVNQDSKLVKLTDLASATAAPNNNPKVLAETALAAGDDDFSHIAASDYIGSDSGTTKTGLQTFKDENLGGGQVAIPGITTTATHAALVAHGEAYHRLALLDPPLASAKSDVATIRALYGTWSAAIYWPWVQFPDYAGSGLLKFYPPSGFAAGACAKADVTIGTHQAPAGSLIGPIGGAVDVERYSNGQPQVDDNTREYLNSKDVNVIAPLPNQGILIYGARVMTADRRVTHVHQIRMLNLLYYSGKLGLAWAVFAVIDGTGKLFRALRGTSVAFLKGFKAAGALHGKEDADAFSVVCDDSNNPKEQLDQGRVSIRWGVKISPTAEQIILDIENVPLSTDLSALQ